MQSANDVFSVSGYKTVFIVLISNVSYISFGSGIVLTHMKILVFLSLLSTALSSPSKDW